jgi:uncharacterized Zn-finger protein
MTFENRARIVMVPRNTGARLANSEHCSRHFMADRIIPHFQNDPGIPVIEIGAHEFMCVGATPPFDHPHVFLDMGDDKEIICPYCSTLYRHDATLDSHAARPAECALPLQPTAV